MKKIFFETFNRRKISKLDTCKYGSSFFGHISYTHKYVYDIYMMIYIVSSIISVIVWPVRFTKRNNRSHRKRSSGRLNKRLFIFHRRRKGDVKQSDYLLLYKDFPLYLFHFYFYLFITVWFLFSNLRLFDPGHIECVSGSWKQKYLHT